MVDKSLALSGAGGGHVHRTLAQSPSSVLKVSSSTKWSGKGSSGGGRKGGSSKTTGSWLERNRNRVLISRCGEMSRQLLEMQEDVDRKVEQMKQLDFQRENNVSMPSWTTRKKKSSTWSSQKKIFASRSDPRSGKFISVKVKEVRELSTGQRVARCDRMDLQEKAQQQQQQQSRDSGGGVGGGTGETTLEVDLVLNAKRFSDVGAHIGCVLRIFEPWMIIPSHAREHDQVRQEEQVPDLLVASNLFTLHV